MKKRNIIMSCLAALIICTGVWILYNVQFNKADYVGKDQYVIGISQANMREAWRLALILEIEKEAEKYDDIRIITMDATDNAQKQEQDIDKLQDFGVDLMIVSPYDSVRMAKKVKNIYRQNIPVIVMDRAIEGFDYSLYIGPDNILIGQQAGECVADLLEDQNKVVLELNANSQSIQSKERIQGFESIVESDSDMQLLSYDMESDSKDQVYDFLLSKETELEGVDIIFANTDAAAVAAYEALQTLRLADRIKIIGCDGFVGEGNSMELVDKGKIMATISCPTGGKEAVQYARNILYEESGVPKQVILRSHTIMQDNVEDYLENLEKECVDDGETIKMGYSQVGMESQWRLANTKSIQEAAKEFNIDLYVENAHQSQKKQIESIRKFIKQGVDVIVVSPVVETGWEDVLKEAKQAGIPVVMSDRKVNSNADLVSTYIGADFIEEGRRAMRWLLEHAPAENETINIMELQGNPGATPTVERKKGFEEVLKMYPEFAITYSEYGDFTYEGGRQIVKDYLEKNKWNIDVIFSHNDDMAFGAIKELELYGIVPGKDVIIISVDATREAFETIIEGKLNCAVECNPLLGPPLMKAVRDMMAGKEMPLRIITEEKVYDSSNVKEEIRKRKY